MSTYRGAFATTLNVTVDAEDEDAAANRAWELAEQFANGLDTGPKRL